MRLSIFSAKETNSGKADNTTDESVLQKILNADVVTNECLVLIDRIAVYDVQRIEIRFAFGDASDAKRGLSELLCSGKV